MRGFDHATILSPSIHGVRKERLAQWPLLCPKYDEKRVADDESRCLRKRDYKKCNNLAVNKEKIAYVISYNRHI